MQDFCKKYEISGKNMQKICVYGIKAVLLRAFLQKKQINAAMLLCEMLH